MEGPRIIVYHAVDSAAEAGHVGEGDVQVGTAKNTSNNAGRRPPSSGRGEPHAALRDHDHLDTHHGQPRPSLNNPVTRCWDQPHYRYAGTDDGRGTDQTLDNKRLTLMRACHDHTYGGCAASARRLDARRRQQHGRAVGPAQDAGE
jgi:hypothetical protein